MSDQASQMRRLAESEHERHVRIGTITIGLFKMVVHIAAIFVALHFIRKFW